MKIALLVFAIVATPLIARAQTAPTPVPSPAPSATPAGVSDPCSSQLSIVSRPSVTTSVCVVKPNHVSIETGYTNTTADGGAPVVQYPQATIRIGTSITNLEFSVLAPSLIKTGGTSGSSDVGFGAKYELGYTSKVAYSVNAVVTAATGTNGFSSGGSNYTYNGNLSLTLSPVFSVATTLGFNSLASNGAQYESFVPSLVVTASLPNNQALEAEEVLFTHGAGPGTPTRNLYDFAYARSFNGNLQVDVEYGRSPTASTGKYRYVGVGLSFYR